MKKCCKGWKLFFIPLIALGLVAFGFVTMYLWNWLMPGIFHLPLITFWEAIGLLILSRLLLGFSGGHHKAMAYHHRNNFREKWENMSPEDREKFSAHRWSCWSGKKNEESTNPNK